MNNYQEAQRIMEKALQEADYQIDARGLVDIVQQEMGDRMPCNVHEEAEYLAQ